MELIIFNFVIGAMSVAGFSAIWRNWVEDHPRWESFIKKVLGKAHKVLTCGPCFTYWVALAFTLIINPLNGWMPMNDSYIIGFLGNIFLRWMAFSWLSVFFRFAYTSLQQYVRKNADA